MKVVYLEGVLMNNNEFVSSGRTMFLSEEQIKKYVKEKKELVGKQNKLYEELTTTFEDKKQFKLLNELLEVEAKID